MRSLRCATATCVLFTSAAFAQPTIVYDALSGVSPAQQCWTYQGSTPPSPSGGVLDFGSSGSAEYRYFSRDDMGGVDFAQHAVVSMRVQVVSGGYSSNPCGAGQRTGVGFGIVDAQGRHLNVGLGSDRVYIGTQNNPFGDANNPSVAYAWGGMTRDVRLEVNNLTFTMFIDGQQVISVSRPAMPASQTTPNLAYFGGDVTTCSSGHGRFERFTVTAIPSGTGNITVTSQPAPTVKACATAPLLLSVSATSPWTLGYQWRRNGVPIINGTLAGNATADGANSPTLSITGYTTALDGVYDCIVANSCGSRTTSPCTVTLPTPCGPADIGRQGGASCPDGELDNNDFIVFIDYFFTSNPLADRGSQGGAAGTDGRFDNNDFIVYIDQFFSGC